MDKPRPRPTATSAPFWDALRVGELRLQRCDACGTWIHYPRNRCPRCLSADISWHTVEPRGTVYTFTVAVAPTAPMFAGEAPQLLAVVELTNGVRMTTTLVDVDPSDVHVGLPVVGVFDHGDDGLTLLRFAPAS